MNKKGAILAFVLASVTSVAHGRVWDECGQEFVPYVQRDSMVYRLKWDYWEDLVYNFGIVSVSATGPVPIAPFQSGFESPARPNDEMYVWLNEQYELPGIWTISGTGLLYRIVQIYPDVVLEYQEDGTQNCNASGAF